LPFADAICDVSSISSTVIDRGTEGLRKQPVARRPGAAGCAGPELPPALGQPPGHPEKTPVPANLNDGVLQERHHALNWLVRFEDREWDDVDTPT
jgi:hypothetical protein